MAVPKSQKRSKAGKNGAGIAKPRRRPNRLQELRLKGFVPTQEQVAHLLGLDSTSVSRHESGERSLTRDQILMYAKLYGVPSHEIFIESEEEPVMSVKMSPKLDLLATEGFTP